MPSNAFTGVPVFQAQGLTVKSETQRYTPLFLAKADLDAAVGAAYGQREASREAAAAEKAQAAEEEVAAAQTAVGGPLSCSWGFALQHHLPEDSAAGVMGACAAVLGSGQLHAKDDDG